MRSLVLALCLVSSLAAVAQETRHRLERILVEGSVIAEEIVRAEARLEEERTYSEEDFRQAVYRIRRLPFVTEATYRIEPGVTAGGTTLVIRIVDTSIVFYDAHVQRDNVTALAGARLLLDDLGVVEAAVQRSDDDEGFNAGVAYRAYDLFGRGAFASIAIAQRFRTDERRYDVLPVLTFGWPLSQKQTLTLIASRAKSRVARELDDDVTLTDRDRMLSAELRWSYESIDDPLFATRGVSLFAGPRWSRADFVRESYDTGEKEIVATTSTSIASSFAVDASAYHPLFGRNVAFVRANGEVSRVREYDGAIRAGLARNCPFRARLELGAGYRENEPFAEGALVVRNRWGTMRFTASYRND